MTTKILKEVIDGFHYKLVLETVDVKPDIKTVLWFSVTNNDGLIPHVSDKSRASRVHNGVVNTKFRETQCKLFKQYYELADHDAVPYNQPYQQNKTQDIQ